MENISWPGLIPRSNFTFVYRSGQILCLLPFSYGVCVTSEIIDTLSKTCLPRRTLNCNPMGSIGDGQIVLLRN